MGTTRRGPRIQLWCPDIFSFKGGIQVYSAFFLAALQRSFPDSELTVILKHDTECVPHTICTPDDGQTKFHFAGMWPRPLRTAVFAAKLFRYGIKQRPNLIITTHLNFTIVGYWLKRLRGIPYWAVAHGVEAWDIESPPLRKALRHADCILAVSHYTRDRLLERQDLDPSKIKVLANTFSSEQFRIAPKPAHLLVRYGLTATQPIILTVSRLVASEKYKGYDQILRTLPQIRLGIPEVHYIIVGKGNDRARLEHLIAVLDLSKSVTLAGYVPADELCGYYNLCDVFAMPSEREGFGIVYLEALACGKPALAGNKDGSTDALCQGELGALVDPDDLGEIARTLTAILQGTYNHEIMYKPERLRNKVIDKFGFDIFKERLS